MTTRDIDRCRSCNAPIWWGTAPDGTPWPFDVLRTNDGALLRDRTGLECLGERHRQPCRPTGPRAPQEGAGR